MSKEIEGMSKKIEEMKTGQGIELDRIKERGMWLEEWRMAEAMNHHNYLTKRYCPKCYKEQPMVILKIRKGIDRRQYRCMGCLTLWDEYEGEVSDNRVKGDFDYANKCGKDKVS